jgi:hypothetical protein
VRGRGEHARRGLVVEIGRGLVAERKHGKLTRVDARVGDRRDVVNLARADKGVDLGHLGAQLVAVALDEATRDDEPLTLPLGLQARGFEDGVDRLFLRRVDKATRVDDERVGLGRVARDLVAFLLQPPHHHLAIDEVLRAAQTDESNFLHVLHE